MRAVDLIRQKRNGKRLSAEEISFLINGYCTGDIPDYQMSAWAMAVFFQGMTAEETADLTTAMAQSGEQTDLSGIGGIKVDKHSTGGVGDKTTPKSISFQIKISPDFTGNIDDSVLNLYIKAKDNFSNWIILISNGGINNPFQLHKATGLSYTVCRSYFSKTAFPSRSSAEKIASYLGMDISSFISFIGIDLSTDMFYDLLNRIERVGLKRRELSDANC
jgi:hypothetical protein